MRFAMCSASDPKATTQRCRQKQRRHNSARRNQEDEGQDVSSLKGTTVSDFLAPSIATCKTTATCDDVKTLLLSRNVGDAYIVDDAGQFVGVVNGSDLAAAAGKEDRPVSDLVRSAAAVVLATDTVETAVRAILAAGRNYLPVVRSSEDQFLVGSVSARELLRAVNMALISADAEAKIR